ncbi:hypothetical protein BJV74DRAFT_820767 [Russula compacta]|nr:hypothetical protein BJV74DRAFT_820767 [Russula compacta]
MFAHSQLAIPFVLLHVCALFSTRPSQPTFFAEKYLALTTHLQLHQAGIFTIDAQHLAIAWPIDSKSVHRITSGQVIKDLQTAAKEPVEKTNSYMGLVEVRFRDYGLETIELIENWTGIVQEDYESIGMLLWLARLPLPL